MDAPDYRIAFLNTYVERKYLLRFIAYTITFFKVIVIVTVNLILKVIVIVIVIVSKVVVIRI
jgi:hypothetical protein